MYVTVGAQSGRDYRIIVGLAEDLQCGGLHYTTCFAILSVS